MNGMLNDIRFGQDKVCETCYFLNLELRCVICGGRVKNPKTEGLGCPFWRRKK